MVELDEYPGKKGMLHISEISSKWVKNIRDFIKEGQKWVAKVISVDKDKGHISLSIKRVNQSAKREKQKEWNNEKKAEKWLEMICEELGVDKSKMYDVIGFELQKKFGTMYAAFEVAYKEGKKELIEQGIPEEWAEKIEEFAKAQIKEREVEIRRILEIRCLDGNGMEIIKEAILNNFPKNAEIKYMAAPKYYFKVTGKDYKLCEKILEEFVNKVNDHLSKHKGYCKVIGEV